MLMSLNWLYLVRERSQKAAEVFNDEDISHKNSNHVLQAKSVIQ